MRTLGGTSSLRPLTWLALAAVTACTPAQEAKPPAAPKPAVVAAPEKPVAAQDEPAPQLRLGEAPIADLGEVRGEVLARFDDDGIETWRIAFKPPSRGEGAPSFHDFVVLPEAPNAPLSFIDESGNIPGRGQLWLRRPKGATGPIRATIIAGPDYDTKVGSRLVVTVPEGARASAGKPADAKARVDFGLALAGHLGERSNPLLGMDAGMRVLRAYTSQPKGRGKAQAPVQMTNLQGDLSDLMRATTGIGALRAALGHDRTLVVDRPAAPTVAVSAIEGPKLDVHPWAQMQGKLGVKAPAEPMAALAPADGWYLRAASLGALFRLLDEADGWGTAAARLAEEVAFDADLAARYETQLGLRRSELARRFGDRVVGEVAIVGSDPYLREGTDVTLLFRVKTQPLFDGALADALADVAKGHGALTTTSSSHEGVTIAIDTTADGAVRRHRAMVGDVAIVSNSLGGVRRVIAVAKGKAPPLSAEADIQYVLARDAAESHDVLGLVGERFVRTIIGPSHKVAESRRQTAHAELLAPGVAAVLHGWLKGAPPASTEALIATRLLDKTELSHASGGAITFTPGQAPRSAWGTPSFLEPLVDRPAVDKVTPAERDAYGRFRQAYEEGWAGEPFDPIALRVALPEKGPMTAHVRVLPIPRDRDMDELMRVVGDARVMVEPSSVGARLVVGLSPDDRWRRDLGLDLGRMIGNERRVLDWIGEWAAVGVADRNGLLVAARDGLAPELPDPSPDAERVDGIEQIARLPLWAGVEVRSPATLGILLTVARKLADDVMPGMVRWGEIGKEGAVSIVAVRIAGETAFGNVEDGDVDIFYAIAPASGTTRAALYVSLEEGLLRGLVQDHVAGRGPRTPTSKSADPAVAQALVDVTAARGGPLATLLAWVAEASARDQQRTSSAFAEWFLRAGAPGSEGQLARAYLGAVPTTPSGKAYAWGPAGVTDPDRGSAAQPRFPAVPVAGTPVAAIVEALARGRIATSFDEEPLSTPKAPLRSFSARLTIDKR